MIEGGEIAGHSLPPPPTIPKTRTHNLLTLTIRPRHPHVKPCVKNVGVYLDSALKFDIQVSPVGKGEVFSVPYGL